MSLMSDVFFLSIEVDPLGVNDEKSDVFVMGLSMKAAFKRSIMVCCPKRMPLRRPVVPEVKRIYAGSQVRNSSSF